jgi:hypothetical protein
VAVGPHKIRDRAGIRIAQAVWASSTIGGAANAALPLVLPYHKSGFRSTIGPLTDVAVNFIPPDSRAFLIASKLLAIGVRLPPS